MAPDCMGQRHTLSSDGIVKPFRWGAERNEFLRAERGLGFEDVVVAIESGRLLDVLTHSNRKRYRDQRIAVIDVGGYVMLVPCVETDGHLFLKTVIPSRKATRDYLGGRRAA